MPLLNLTRVYEQLWCVLDGQNKGWEENITPRAKRQVDLAEAQPLLWGEIAL
jgi:hypothetical protein